jgi:hypothetical protein
VIAASCHGTDNSGVGVGGDGHSRASREGYPARP